MQKILLILADGFEEIEALGTADILRRLKFEVVLAGLNARNVTASHGVKVTAAICAAPIVLARAGLLDGRKFTMYPAEGLFQYLGEGLRPLPDLAVTDGTVVTGKGPGATPAFAAAIARALGMAEKTVAAELAAMFF